MASLHVLAFDHEGRPVPFDTWLDDLQLYLLIDSKDSVLPFDLASGGATAPPATANSSTRSHWLTRDAAARLAIRNHLPLAECANFGQHRTAQAQYDAVVTRYSSPATAALGRLLLPYLFPKLSAFATIEDLVSHLRASDARYRAALPAKFLDRNPPPMDHFLSLDPTSLTVDLLEQHLIAGETSAVAVGATRGTPRPPFFEGCSPSPLAPSYASADAVDISVPEDVGAASASAKRRSSKGKGGQGGGGGSGGGGGGSYSGGGGSSGGGGGGATIGGSGGSGGGGGGSGGSGSGGGGTGSGGTGARRVGYGGGQRQQQQRRSETPSPQQLGIATAALGASESGTLPGTAPAEALHTFTLDPGASACFFRDSTTLTPLPAPVPVRLADSSGGPVMARSSTVLSCPVVRSGSLSGLHLPSFSTNLVSTAALQDAMVTTTTPGGSSLYTLTTKPSQTLLWHQRLCHPSLPRLCGMHSRLLVSGLPRSLPPLPPSPAPPCLPCVEGRQRAAPHSSSFPPTTAPLQTLHMDMWGPARDLPVLRLHSNRGGEFSSNLLRDFCRGEGILQTFTLPDSPQQNGIAERRIGLVIEYAAHQLNLWPRVSELETSPTLRWTGKVGDASVFRVWGALSLVRNAKASKLSSRTLRCVFLGSPPTPRHGSSTTRARVESSPPRMSPLTTRPCPHAVPDTHGMALCPSSIPQRVVLPEPPASSLPHVPDRESDLARAASPTITGLLATVVTDPDFESTSAFALVTELVGFAARSRLDYVASLVTESESVCPLSVGGEPPLAAPGLSAPTATAAGATAAPTATAAHAYCATMALLQVLAFDHESRPVQFDTWLDDLQLYLVSDSKDSISLFDLAPGAATAPPAIADSATRSQWLTRDAAARLAIRNHLPLAECAHFGQHKTAQALYAAVVARYSSLATAALGRRLLPYLFPELSAFATVEDLVSHLRTSDARYRATIPAEFLDRNQPHMFITLYFIVTHLPDSLRSVKDHFLSLDPTSLDPTSLTIDLLEQHLLAAETSAVAVGAARGTPRPPFFEGCSPSPLAPSYTSAAAADVSVAEDVGDASASAKRRSSICQTYICYSLFRL
ncbi:unnamed protein product [Closterium sp. NIES-53]